jgi:hypothetical protein
MYLKFVELSKIIWVLHAYHLYWTYIIHFFEHMVFYETTELIFICEFNCRFCMIH